jgi:hypothetical protein
MTVRLPFNDFVGRGAAAHRVTAGWAGSGVTSIASGEPVQIVETDDRPLIGAHSNFDVPSFLSIEVRQWHHRSRLAQFLKRL